MSYLLIVILDDIKRMPELLKAWRSIGVPGVTILQSTGGHRTATWLSQVGLGALDRLFDTEEIRRRTLMTAVDEEELMEDAVAEAERVIGGFDRPESGILLVLPILKSKGLKKRRPQKSPETLPEAMQPDWYVNRTTGVDEVLKVLDLEPTIIREDTPLNEIAKEMLKTPSSHIACVVNEDDRLVGLISLQQLADDLFFHIVPEEFISEITDLEGVLQYANLSRLRTAADAMSEPIWVTRDEKVKDAFERMHEHRLSGLPVVDSRYKVIGYINLLELLAVSLDRNASTDHLDEQQ
jgi:CBS domain-containing protein